MSLFTRRHRVEQLAALGDVTGLGETLVDAAREGGARADELCAAASALVDLGEDGISTLVEVILTDPEHVHFGRIEDETFHRAAGPHAVGLLSDALLHHPDTDVRLAACGMLRRLDTPLADAAFAAAVTDPDPHVRLAAGRGLADHGDRRGLRALLEWVAHSDDPGPALAGLAHLGDARIVPLLEQLRSSSRTPSIARAIDRTITELKSVRTGPPDPVARLQRVRDRLRSIEVVDRLEDRGTGPGTELARQQIPAICDNIDHAVVALRTGETAEGRPIGRTQIGLGLAALVEDVSGSRFDRLMATVLAPRGVRAMHDEVVELDLVATDLQERARPSSGVAG